MIALTLIVIIISIALYFVASRRTKDLFIALSIAAVTAVVGVSWTGQFGSLIVWLWFSSIGIGVGGSAMLFKRVVEEFRTPAVRCEGCNALMMQTATKCEHCGLVRTADR